jgi:hypothetical protein
VVSPYYHSQTRTALAVGVATATTMSERDPVAVHCVLDTSGGVCRSLSQYNPHSCCPPGPGSIVFLREAARISSYDREKPEAVTSKGRGRADATADLPFSQHVVECVVHGNSHAFTSCREPHEYNNNNNTLPIVPSCRIMTHTMRDGG